MKFGEGMKFGVTVPVALQYFKWLKCVYVHIVLTTVVTIIVWQQVGSAVLPKQFCNLHFSHPSE